MRHSQTMSQYPGAVPLAALDETLENAGENLGYYTWITSDDQAEQALARLVELVTASMQQIAADITDAAASNRDLSPADIVASLRARAAQLCPDSARYYDPHDADSQ